MSVEFLKNGLRVPVHCYRNLNLLAHAQMEEIDLGSQCGGHGKCGMDRIQILNGRESISPPNEIETRHLSEQAIDQGWRLACQAWPDQETVPIEVTVP